MEEKEELQYPHLPELFSAKVAQDRFGLSRSMCYELLSNPACGVVRIGARKFFLRDRFLKWLDEQTLDQGA